MRRQLRLIGGILIVITIITIITIIQRGKTQVFPDQLVCKECNIIFVSFDTLRADHVGALGYNRNTTPNIDRFVANAFTFTNAMTVTTWTLPSTMSWFTGVYPSTHKLLNKFVIDDTQKEEIAQLSKLAPQLKTLAQVLKENGYATGGFTGGAGVDHQFGFNQGFDEYFDTLNFGGLKDSVPKAVSWIKDHKDGKFFVFLHGYDIHGQYVPDGGYDKRFVDFDYKGKLTGSKEEQQALREEGLTRGNIFLTPDDVRFLIAIYDEKISRADNEFQKFIEAYQSSGVKHPTMFIFTSDHGEEFYEHGRIDHGHSLYDELLHVPLFIIVPTVNKGIAIKDQVRSIDLMPTIFDLLGVVPSTEVKGQMQGMSLLSLLRDQHLSLDAFAETDYRYVSRLRSLQTSDKWKLIIDLDKSVREFYNINRDPGEKNNLASQISKQFIEATDKLQEFLQRYQEI